MRRQQLQERHHRPQSPPSTCPPQLGAARHTPCPQRVCAALLLPGCCIEAAAAAAAVRALHLLLQQQGVGTRTATNLLPSCSKELQPGDTLMMIVPNAPPPTGAVEPGGLGLPGAAAEEALEGRAKRGICQHAAKAYGGVGVVVWTRC